MGETENILVVENLKKYFKTTFGTVKAVDDITFNVRFGETFGLVGESGSGKSTTGYIIMGIYRPTSGKILFKGQDISVHTLRRPKHTKKYMPMVFQDRASSLNPSKTIREIVGLPLKVHGLVNSTSELTEKVAKLLETVELPPERFMHKRPGTWEGAKNRQRLSQGPLLQIHPS